MKIIGVIFGYIALFSFVIWVLKVVANPTPANLDQIDILIAQAAIPWWIPIIEFLAKVGNAIGGIAIAVFLFLLVKSN